MVERKIKHISAEESLEEILERITPDKDVFTLDEYIQSIHKYADQLKNDFPADATDLMVSIDQPDRYGDIYGLKFSWTRLETVTEAQRRIEYEELVAAKKERSRKNEIEKAKSVLAKHGIKVDE